MNAIYDNDESVLQPPAGVGPFHWHRCLACKQRGYRATLQDRYHSNGLRCKVGALDDLTYTKVVSWHSKIAHEMWDDFLKKGSK